MSILNILKFPNKLLFKKSNNVKNIDSFRIIINNMIDTLFFNNGLGIAAPQVSVNKKIIIINISNNYKQPLIIINPQIIYQKGTIITKEGCLSFPNTYISVKRKKIIKIKFKNNNGETIILKADKLLSICIQHELDHLNGITLYNKMSQFKKSIFLKKTI